MKIVQLIQTDQQPRSLRTSSGRVHVAYFSKEADGEAIPWGTACGLSVNKLKSFTIVHDGVTCKNCLHPGHNNLWMDDKDSLYW